MTTRRARAWALLTTSLTLALAGVAVLPAPAAHADHHVLPENEGDIGVYTDGESDVMDIGDPTYTNVDGVEAQLAPGVSWTAGSMYQSIFDKDLAAGGTDYYLDRVLGVRGALGPAVLQTRGRSLYLRGASANNFAVMGFAGSTFVGGPNNLGNLYTVTVPGQTVTEVPADRFNAPSHFSGRYTVGDTGVSAELTKFITYDNVAVTAVTFDNPGAEARTFTVRAASPLANTPGADDDELTGRRTITSGANNGLVDTPWVRMDFGLKADGFTRTADGLDREVTVPAGGSLSLSVAGVAYHDQLPASYDSFREYAALAPADAVRTGVTDFNRRWAQDIPFVDVDDPGIEKAIVYRWWGERYNVLDAAAPGYVYQYPTTVEGSNLYQNAVALTQPMHLQDTKWMRTPYLGYGQVLNIGELSGSSAFLDSPGHTSWNNHYSQYLGTAGLEAYEVHGGGPQLAQRFGEYFENDGVGQLEHYDGNGNNLIAYDTNYMPGNDADAISFGFPKANAGAEGARTIERPESAYVWGDFDAARQLYAMAGAETGKVEQMQGKADDIRDAILQNLWSPDMRMFLARTSYGAKSGPASGGTPNPLPEASRDLIPAKESNLYDVYSENLIPVEDREQYVDGFRFLTYGDNFPIFPFYTANQHDKDAYGIGGSNNFSNINFTVQYRAVRAALRHYDPDGKYLTPAYAARLLRWMAWSIYPGGDLRAPNQSEYYSNWNPETKTYNRNNPNHVMLGNMNYIYVEDMGGVQPRSDDKIELWPIDLGHDHFMVNNLRYHGHDLTIVWDPDGTEYGLGAGYSLFVDGERKVSAAQLGHLTYDPAANTVDAADGVEVTYTAPSGVDLPTAVETPIEDERVVDYLKSAGIDLTEDAANLATAATLSSSATQQGPRPTPWRDFHTPGSSTSAMNHTPGAIAEDERPVSLDAVTDGITANEPYWGNYGTEGDDGYVELDLGETTSFDNVKVYFVSDRQPAGYSEPARWFVEVPDGSGGWTPVGDQFKSPTVPAAKFNEALFDSVDSDRVRVAFTDAPGRSTAISEIQVYDSGREVPPVENQAPTVTASVDAAGGGNLSARLVGTVVDDGVPYDQDLDYGWEVVSAPEGGVAILESPSALTTTIDGTVPGEYVVRFFADDGEKRSEAEVTVELTERDTVAEFGATATITHSGQPAWEDAQKVNDATDPRSSAPGAGNGWGTYGQQRNGSSPERAAWIRYSWDSPVRVSSTSIYWYDDNGGTRRPKPDGYVVESSDDGENWTPVELTGDAGYGDALAVNTYNPLTFEPLSTTNLRIRITGIQGDAAGTGVLRWRVNGEALASVRQPVLMRTPTGVVPQLPANLDVVYESGARGTLPFTWQEITPEMVAETNTDPFTVYGTNRSYGVTAEARIYVRPENSPGGISIQGAESFEQTVAVGEQPYLPTKVEVSYNDGSRDNQAIGVEWRYDPDVVQRPGTYRIVGDLVLPEYVSEAGTVQTTLTLTVTGDGPGPDPDPDPEDTTAPRLTVTGVRNGAAYQDIRSLMLRWKATDAGSGVRSTSATLDGRRVRTGTVRLLPLPLGGHRLVLRATDRAGNTVTRTVRFSTVTTAGSVRTLVNRYIAAGRIPSTRLQRELRSHARAAHEAVRAHRPKVAARELERFVVVARQVRRVQPRAVLIRDARWLVRRLR